MHDSLQNINQEGKKFFRDHPEQLINISAIAVAFLSRDMQGPYLKVGKNVISKERLLSKYHQECFEDVCKIKDAIRGALQNYQSWPDLMAFINSYQIETPEIKQDEEWVLVTSDNEIQLIPNQQNPHRVSLDPDRVKHLKGFIRRNIHL